MANFVRGIGFISATTLVVGSAIGSGIFLLPSEIARNVGSPFLLLLVFVVGGLLSLAGALTFAEMGGMFPRAGGQYVFLREAFGDGPAFLFGWMTFWVSMTGIIAAVATAFALYASTIFPLDSRGIRILAVGVVFALTGVNALGVRHAAAVQNLFTFAKVAAILGLVLFSFLLHPSSGWWEAPLLPEKPPLWILGSFGVSLVSALFAYDGWASLTFVAAEIQNPERTIPKAAFVAVLVVAAVYLSAVLAYLHVLGSEGLPSTPVPASEAARSIGGPKASTLIAWAIMISTFGTVNAYVLQGPRVYHAMAESGLHYRGFAELDERTQVPLFGLLVQAEWASILVLTGTYLSLVQMITISLWGFYALAGVALFVLRRKLPDHPRPYRAWGYPIVPALFVASAIFIVLNSLVFDTRNALEGLGLVASGIPFFFLLRRGIHRSERQSESNV